MTEQNNKQWSGRFGFIMAVVGSAVGLGNIWRFPYVAGTQGGAIFLLVYVFMVIVLGFTLSSAEIAVGRHSQKNIVSAFGKRHKNWTLIGFLCISICFMIASYYSVIGGWIVKYLSGYIVGGGFVSGGNHQSVFTNFISHPFFPLIFNVVFIAAIVAILIFGVKNGIEKISKILMPALFIMLIFIMIVSLCMDGAIEGVKFFFVPNWASIAEHGGIGGIIVAAMGQAFFSLNVGLGVNATYGAYLKKDVNIPKNTAIICGFDTLVAVLAGLAILPAVFSVGLEPSAGPGLIFETLPAVFASLGSFGIALAAIFFLLILFAAITSAMSLFELMIAFVSEKFKIKRLYACIIVGGIILITSTIVSLSQSGLLGNVDLIDMFDTVTTVILIPLSAIFICLYIGLAWKAKNAANEVFGELEKKSLWIRVWEVNITFVAPILIFTVFIFGIIGLF